MEPMLGSIMTFAGNFAPRGWMLCQGQTLAIQSNTALFSILGTTYGGNGQTTFQLPNLNGRVAVGAGAPAAPGGAYDYQLGESAGTDTTTLTINQLPAHTHAAVATGQSSAVTVNVQTPAVSNSDANVAKPASNHPGKTPSTSMYSNAAPDSTMAAFTASGSVTPAVTVANAITGNGQPFDNRQPLLALNYIICIQGFYPARN